MPNTKDTRHVFTFRLLQGSEKEWSRMLRDRLRRSLQWLEGVLDAPEVEDSDLQLKLEHRIRDLNAVSIGLQTPLFDTVMHRLTGIRKRSKSYSGIDVYNGMYDVWDDFVDDCRCVCRDDSIPDIILEVTRYNPIGMTAERWTFWTDGYTRVELGLVQRDNTPVQMYGVEGVRYDETDGE